MELAMSGIHSEHAQAYQYSCCSDDDDVIFPLLWHVFFPLPLFWSSMHTPSI
jgi:hypothetical protein